jgi:predicted metal-binding membrane protein
MLVLFIAGSMSLVWMAGLSVVIFSEKVSTKRTVVTRGIGAILILLGAVIAVQSYLMT